MDDFAFPQPKNTQTQKKADRKFQFSKKFLKITAGLLTVVALIAGGLATIKLKPEILGLAKPETAPQEEIEDIVEKVSKLMIIPSETPQLATLTNLEGVQNQQFFRNALAGDKVLVFKNAKRAIIYRPSEDLIVEVGVVREGSAPEVAGTTDNTTPTPATIIETDLFLPDDTLPEQIPTATSSPTPTDISPTPSLQATPSPAAP
jgi:hypothetical protein